MTGSTVPSRQISDSEREENPSHHTGQLLSAGQPQTSQPVKQSPLQHTEVSHHNMSSHLNRLMSVARKSYSYNRGLLGKSELTDH